jgi:hypothetical protein
MSLQNPNSATYTKSIKPSRTNNTQDDCPLFKLAAETRNEIYAIVFSAKTREDGSMKLEDVLESNALTRTCQQIYAESHKMHQLANRNYPSHNFTPDVPDRQKGLSVPRLSYAFFQRITSFCVTWRADEHNNGKPLRFTSHCHKKTHVASHFTKKNHVRSRWSVRVELHDEYWRGQEAGDTLARLYARVGKYSMNEDRGSWYASKVSCAIYAGPKEEEWIWTGWMCRWGCRNGLIVPCGGDTACVKSSVGDGGAGRIVLLEESIKQMSFARIVLTVFYRMVRNEC